MPANRSRTERWRQTLEQIASRGGALEIAVAGDREGNPTFPDLMWRVRVLDVGEEEILVEQPSAMGRAIGLAPNVEMIAVMTVGQNRWMFSTRNLGRTQRRLQGRDTDAVRLAAPQTVERCQRRDFERMDTAAIRMPLMSVWPLLNPATVVIAEQANELGLESRQHAETAAHRHPSLDTMPDVGPEFNARLMNIGGGGVGLLVEPANASAVNSHKHLWLRLALPGLEAPICATARVVHSHIESSGHTYAGLAFDFSFNPAHERFVVDQICAYVGQMQHMQAKAA